MKVRELIKELKKLDQNMEACMSDIYGKQTKMDIILKSNENRFIILCPNCNMAINKGFKVCFEAKT